MIFKTITNIFLQKQHKKYALCLELVCNHLQCDSKSWLMEYFSHSVFFNKHKFLIKIEKYYQIWNFEIDYFITLWNSRKILKFHNWQVFSILIRNFCSLAKTEWKKYPVYQLLESALKSFQIRRFWIKKIDNNPCHFLVSKVA